VTKKKVYFGIEARPENKSVLLRKPNLGVSIKKTFSTSLTVKQTKLERLSCL